MNKVWFEQNLFPRPSHSCCCYSSRVQWLETGQQWTLDSELERVGSRDFNRGEGRWGRRVSEGGGGDLLSGGRGGLMNTVVVIWSERNEDGRLRLILILFTGTLLFFRNGMTRWSTYLYPGFYLGAKIFFSLFPATDWMSGLMPFIMTPVLRNIGLAGSSPASSVA